MHELRYTFASLSNYVGTQEFDIGKVLGHFSPSKTKKIYTHLFDKKQTDAMNAVADILEKGDFIYYDNLKITKAYYIMVKIEGRSL